MDLDDVKTMTKMQTQHLLAEIDRLRGKMTDT
jgi:hypothetical protein